MSTIRSEKRSSARNAFGRDWSKNASIRNLATDTSRGVDRLVDASSALVAVPWKTGGSGALALLPLGFTGAVPNDEKKQPPLLNAHASSVAAFQLAPLASLTLATAARDRQVKVWRLPSNETLVPGTIPTEPIVAFDAVPKRVEALQWHCSAANVLAVAGGGDNVITVCDVLRASVVSVLNGASDRATSLAWSDDGAQLAVANRDRSLRIYDVRAQSKPIAERAAAHSGSKGFVATFVPRYDEALGSATMSAEPICTVGFGDGACRELALWDQRKLATPLLRSTIDHDSGWLQPFYDSGTGVLFLGGKGRAIYYYELNPAQGTAQLINKHLTATAFDALCLVPKRVLDTRECELARFLLLTSTGTIDTVSIHVPRKNKDVFHDDVYERVPSGEPSSTAEEWSSGARRPIATVSLRPKGMRSVYDLSLEDGGKERSLVAVETTDVPTAAVATDKSGSVQRKLPGWLYSSFDSVFAKLSRPMASLFLFKDDKAASPLQTYVLKNATATAAVDNETDFEIVTRDNVHVVVRVADRTERDSWLASIRLIVSAAEQVSPLMSPLVTPGSSPPTQSFMEQARASPANTKSGLVPRLSFGHMRERTEAAQAAAAAAAAASGHEHSSVDMLMSHREELVTPRITASSAQRIEGELLRRGTSFRDKEAEKHNTDTQKLPTKGRAFASLRYGILAFYKDKQHCRTAVRDPVDSLHIDRLVAVRVLEEVGISSDDNDDDDAADDESDDDADTDAELRRNKSLSSQSCAFRVVTPDRIIDLVAASASERARWVRHLSSEIEDSDDARRTRQGSVFEYGGFMFGWQARFLAVYGQELLMFTDQSATEPLKRLALSNLTEVELVPETVAGVTSQSGLRLEFSTGTKLRLRGTSEVSARRWAECLSFLRKFASDVYAQLLPDVADNIEGAEVESDQAMQADGTMLEMTLVKKGDQRIMLLLYNDSRRLRLFQVPASVRVLREDCVVVLDTGTALWQWNGRTSARILRAKGMDYMNRVNKKERGGLATIYVLNDGRAPDTDDAPVERFWRALGVGSEPTSAQVAVAAHPAIQYVHPMVFAVMRDLSLCFVHEGATPARTLLHSDNAYIVDCLNEIYVWIGKSSDMGQRKRALRVAKLMRTRVDLEGHRRCDVHGEPFARIMRVIEDGEPMIFRERFTGFPGMLPINMTRVEKASKVAKRREQPRIDIPALLDAPRAPLPDIAAAGPGEDGELVGPPVFPTSGPGVTVKVWVIEEFDKRPVQPKDYGRFFAGDSYVVLLTYERKGAPANIIFFHQGRDSSVNEQGTSAYMTRLMQDDLKGDCTQIRVLQGKEPADFLKLFDRAVVLRRGDYKRDASAAPAAAKPLLLFVQGFDDDCVRAVEVDASWKQLVHEGVFLLIDAAKERAFRWIGAHARDCERACADRVLKRYYAQCTNVVDEKPNGESKEFWATLGGAASEPLEALPKRFDTRVFELSSASGIVAVEPLAPPLRQDDLGPRSVYIVDSGVELFVRFGSQSLHNERLFSLQVAQQLAAQSADKPTVWVTQEEKEPPGLRLLFHGWSNTVRGKELPTNMPWQDPIDQVLEDYTRVTFSYAELLDGDNLPKNVDRTRLEDYLTDDEFQQVFQMTRADWTALPQWRLPELKKKANLF
jgi:WD40 repeat protein